MNMKRTTKIFLALAGALILTLSLAAYAQYAGHAHQGFGPPAGGCGGACEGCAEGRMHGGGMHGHMLHALLRDLDLTSAQHEQIHALFMAQHEAMGDQHGALQKVHQDLLKLALSDSYSEEAVAGVISTATASLTEAAQAHTRTLNAAYQILTPEQRQQLAQNLADLAEHPAERR